MKELIFAGDLLEGDRIEVPQDPHVGVFKEHVVNGQYHPARPGRLVFLPMREPLRLEFPDDQRIAVEVPAERTEQAAREWLEKLLKSSVDTLRLLSKKPRSREDMKARLEALRELVLTADEGDILDAWCKL